MVLQMGVLMEYQMVLEYYSESCSQNAHIYLHDSLSVFSLHPRMFLNFQARNDPCDRDHGDSEAFPQGRLLYDNRSSRNEIDQNILIPIM